MSIIRYTFFSHDNLKIRINDFNEYLQNYSNQQGYVWIDLFDPIFEDLIILRNHFNLHHLSIDDCMDENQLPKCEDFSNYTFVIFNNFYYKNNNLSIEEINIFLGKNYIITIHGRNYPEYDFFDKFYDTSVSVSKEIFRGPDFLMQYYLDYIVDNKFLALEEIQDLTDSIEGSIIDTSDKFDPRKIMDIRSDLLKLHKSLFHEREILIKLCRKDSPFISEGSIYYYRDIYDHLAKFFEFIEMNREMITSLMELYLSMININMNKISNQTNTVMKRLTLITTIFMPLNLIAGILGMSEFSMMFGPDNWKLSYPVLFLFMCCLGYLNYIFLKWKKWV